MKKKSSKLKISKGLNWALTGIGAAFIGAAITLGIFVFILVAAGEIRNWLEKFIAKNFISQNYAVVPTPRPSGTASNFPDEGGNFTYLSFTDLFSGFGWLDKSKTTLFYDYSAAAFYLPPVLEWKKSSNTGVSSPELFYAYSLDGVNASFEIDGQAINLPENLQDKDLINVSARKLSSIFLVGVVYKIADSHYAEVFSVPVDSLQFSKPIISFNSSYPGVLGFGGEDNNWLTIYGAYKGAAYQVKNGEINDLSRLFDIRLMTGGFWPAAVHGVDTWYVYNGKESAPARLIKLFENGTGSVQGAMDLTPKLPFSETRGMRVTLDGYGNLLVAVSGAFGEQYWQLEDKGFDNSKNYEIYSLNLLGGPAETKYASISSVSHSAGGAEFRWSISTDLENWQAVKPGELKELQRGGDKLFWRVMVIPSKNSKYSPFLEDIRLDYRLKPKE